MTKINLNGLSQPELIDWLETKGEKPYRAQQLMQWIYGKGVSNFVEMTNISKSFRDHLTEQAYVAELKLVVRQDSRDGTHKYLFELEDGNRIESVFMPTERRTTLCLSSQVGCGMGCTFCATAKMGLIRNLQVWEIVEQARYILKDQNMLNKKEKINVVMMGMGEPLANYQNLIPALKLMSDDFGLQIGQKRITVSTVGLAPKIYQLADEGLKVGLAISLNSTSDEVRSKIIPINRKYSIEELKKAARYYVETVGRRVTFEYVLLAGENDSLDDAKRLINLVHGIPCKINLIRFNGHGKSDYQRPLENSIHQFREYLLPRTYAVTLRDSRGEDIAAACGQLQGDHQS